MNGKPLDVLVVGAGMYVTGAGTAGYGTILPALCQASKRGLVARATISATNPANRDFVLSQAAAVQQRLASPLQIDYAADSVRAADRGRYDCVIVSVPDHLHFELTRELIARGLHVLVVKPFVPTLAEADELIRFAAEKRVYGAVEFHKRFDEANLRAKRMLREGAIGDVLYAVVEFSQRRTIPLETFAAWSARTNIFQYLGVHYADLIWFTIGATPLRVSALGQRNLLASHGIDTWDAVQATIEWRAGEATFVSTIVTNWIDPPATSAMSDQKIKWIGTKGRIESEQKDRGLQLVTGEGVQHVNPYFSEYLYDADDQLQFGGYGARSIEQFLRDVASIAGGAKQSHELHGARATFTDARVSTAVVEAANRSLGANGAWVEVPR
jgi:predicted dehydrogenase